ncbi:N-acyl homoserine lactone hydrolase [Friedmanniella luteola]|uniref:N-acyl homoserine lactone hydrolase n=1 Tax=Friedmanniella luteola TaxID=546871 RepID=A0A1H1RPT2_9ACTN|nr:N-acyl homoserine lactonase family protein [Friedmanniella luteola]SDS37735.1 N-acyl homoserine lactone hydrolase [Friedmanniella luteola]
MALAERMFVLQYGAERVSKALSLAGGDPGHLYWEPLVGVLVETSAGWVLFDTGMSRRNHDSVEVERVYRGADAPSAAERWHLRPAAPPDRSTWGLPGEPLVAALAPLGLAPADLALAVVSHLHWDHTGGIPALAGAGVEVVLHADELAWGRSGLARFDAGFDAADWTVPGTRWRTVDVETEVAPGVRVLPTPGHTPGHVSVQVDLPATGTWIFTADATDLAQNLLDAVPCGSCAGGSPEDERRAAASLELLLARARATDARLIPGHDQVVLTAIRHPPGGHR